MRPDLKPASPKYRQGDVAKVVDYMAGGRIRRGTVHEVCSRWSERTLEPDVTY